MELDTPGLGATATFAWSQSAQWRATITAWREDRHVRWQDDVDPESGDNQLLTEFFLLPVDDHVRLRLVQSGFATDDDLAVMLEGAAAAWSYYLAHLRHYLLHHFGRKRVALSQRRVFEGQRSEVWRSILDADSGLVLADAGGIEVGGELNITFDDRSSLQAEVISLFPERVLGLSLPQLNEAILLIEIEAGLSNCQCSFRLSTYDWDRNDDLEVALQRKVSALQASR